MFIVKLNVQQGFQPRHFTFPQNAITLKQVIRRYHKAQGRNWGGQAQSPPSLRQCFIFHVKFKEFSRA
jgi:hypothetical protein